MIYIACAMYMEAAPFIRRFACKRDDSFSHCQVFCGEEATVVVTGTSPVPAAIALTEVLAKMPPAGEDIFANVGMCGCADPDVVPGTLFLIHSIHEHATGRRFYPDLLYLHEHRQASLTTYSTVMTELPEDEAPVLFDTEAAGLYQAALPFFSTDRMYYFKIVSDFGDDSEDVSPTEVFEYMDVCAPSIADTLLRFASYVPRRYLYSPEEESVIAYFCRCLHCSVTMELELRRLITYYELERGYAIAHLRDFFAEHGLSYEDDILLDSRKEGKHVLQEFRFSCLM